MKTFITAVVMTTSIALSGNVATAAQTHTKTAAAAHAVTHKVQPRHVAVRRPAPAQQQVAFPGIFGALLGFPGAPAASRGKTDVGEYVPSMESPTYDTGPTIDYGAWASQQAADAEAAAMQREQIDLDQMTATQQAVNEQTALDAQNTLQTELNAGM